MTTDKPATADSGIAGGSKRTDEGIDLPELMEAAWRGGRIDVNVLLINISQKAEDPDALVEEAQKLLMIAEKFEAERLRRFKATANAVIDVKSRDPDERDKRYDNRVRNALKMALGFCAIGATGGSILSVTLGAGVVTTGLLVAMGCMSIAMLGPLASGEPIGSKDVAKVVEAVKEVMPP